MQMNTPIAIIGAGLGGLLRADQDDGTGGRPEVVRGELRRILLESLPADAVRWGHKAAAVAPLGGGLHRVDFDNGATITTHLLVGADGAWSKVRPLVSPATPIYSGITYVETWLHAADARHPASAQAVGGDAMFAMLPGRGIFAHREPDGVLHTYAALNKPAGWIAGSTSPNARPRWPTWPRNSRAGRRRSPRSSPMPTRPRCRARFTRCPWTTAGSACPASRCWATPRT